MLTRFFAAPRFVQHDMLSAKGIEKKQVVEVEWLGLARRNTVCEVTRGISVPVRTKQCAAFLVVADLIVALAGLTLLFAAPACGDLAKADEELAQRTFKIPKDVSIKFRNPPA